MKSIFPLSIVALFLQSSLLSWGKQSSPEFKNSTNQPRPTAAELNFPLSDHQQWLAQGSYLYWRPYEDAIDYGIRVNVQTNTAEDFAMKIKMKKPHLDWNSGVRVGIGTYLPDHEFWDLSLFTTYYYNEGSNHTSPNILQNQVVNSSWNLGVLGTGAKSSVKTQLNLFIWDITAGRNFSLTSWLALHPFIGVRGSLITQSYTNRNLGLFSSARGAIFPFKTGFKAHNELYGAGPRIGTDVAFQLGNGWSFIGDFSASFIWAHYEIREKIDGRILVPAASQKENAGLESIKMRAKDAANGLRTNLEGYFGISWERWTHNHTVRIAPSLRFEISEWFAVNHWFSTFNTGQVNPSLPGASGVFSKRHYGDLGFRGFSANLQADF